MSLEPDKLFCPLFCFSIVLYRIESNAYLTLYRQESHCRHSQAGRKGITRAGEIGPDVPLENIEAMCQAMEEFCIRMR